MSKSSRSHDRLTGLPNRDYLLHNLDGILGHNGQIVLMLFAIDHCLVYRDCFGPLQRDKEIIKVGREIQAIMGESSLLCRWDADNFGVILYESSLEDARIIAENIRAKREPISVVLGGQLIVTFTLSIGIAHFPDQSFNSQSLVEAAELALRTAKSGGISLDGTPFSGGNRVVAVGDFLEAHWEGE